jgi:hypothetical protein
MEEFMGPLRLLLGTLGSNVLEPLPRTPERTALLPTSTAPEPDDMVYRLSKSRGSVDATGFPAAEGFMVLVGSVGSLEDRSSLTESRARLRKKFLDDGTFVAEGETFRLTRDVMFSSPSAASSTLAGYTLSGPGEWKLPDGRSLKDVETATVDAASVGTPSD